MTRADRRGDEEELDPVEAADELSEDDDELDGFTDVDDPEDLDADIEDDVLDDELEDEFDGEADELTVIGEDDDDVAIPTDVDLVEAVADDDDDDDDDDALREGEFVCRSCFMAKRESALADPKNMLCRDCA